MRGKNLLVAVALTAFLLTLALYDPWSRVQFFQAFGIGDWAYEHLTTVGDKVAMINNHYNPGGEQIVLSYSPQSGFGPFYGGKEMIWLISDQPFVLKSAPWGYDAEDGMPLERLDDDTLVFNSREYPITLTFTRTDPSPEDAAVGHELVSFFIHAARRPR